MYIFICFSVTHAAGMYARMYRVSSVVAGTCKLAINSVSGCLPLAITLYTRTHACTHPHTHTPPHTHTQIYTQRDIFPRHLHRFPSYGSQVYTRYIDIYTALYIYACIPAAKNRDDQFPGYAARRIFPYRRFFFERDSTRRGFSPFREGNADDRRLDTRGN